MWLPTSVYERVPQFWLLLGLLFMTSGSYLGFEHKLAYVYFGVGFLCCVWSAWVYSKRKDNDIRPEYRDVEAEPVDAGPASGDTPA